MPSNKPTEVDSMNRLRVQAENKAALYRRALVLACNGDEDQVAYFVSEAGTAIDAERECRECAIQPCDTCPDGVAGTPAAEYLAKVEADPKRAAALQRARERAAAGVTVVSGASEWAAFRVWWDDAAKRNSWPADDMDAAWLGWQAARAAGVMASEPTQREKDMALMLKRMCRRLAEGDNMREAVTDYLRRNGLLGSPLRADDSGVTGTLNDQGEQR